MSTLVKHHRYFSCKICSMTPCARSNGLYQWDQGAKTSHRADCHFDYIVHVYGNVYVYHQTVLRKLMFLGFLVNLHFLCIMATLNPKLVIYLRDTRKSRASLLRILLGEQCFPMFAQMLLQDGLQRRTKSKIEPHRNLQLPIHSSHFLPNLWSQDVFLK